MPLVDARDLLGHAGRHGYAVCAFDLAGLDFLTAVTAAAENARAPVILSVAEPHLEYLAAEHFLPAVEAAARGAAVPVAVQFNRATSVASAVRAVRLGCNGITASEAGHAREECMARTRAMVETAHGCGVPVEGRLNGVESVTGGTPAARAVVREYVERTGVDSLAVAATPASSPERVRLDFGRLGRIRGTIPLPLSVDAAREFT